VCALPLTTHGKILVGRPRSWKGTTGRTASTGVSEISADLFTAGGAGGGFGAVPVSCRMAFGITPRGDSHSRCESAA
jgi:hypothetical protein